MANLLVIHHSASGGTRALVAAFVEGAHSAESTRVLTRSADVATATDLLSADGVVFASPENFGYMAGSLKAFVDRSFYQCMADTTSHGGGTHSKLAGRPYSVLICAGNDGTGAMYSIDRIVTGWRLRKVHPGLIARRVGGEAGSSRGTVSETDLQAARELGQLFAEGLAIGVL
ncbi:MAG: NAD(P)H-dependent oxidoreductase [Burkholderiales bacterium]|nr:NAD(P)H-dependent oxidoreductase [Burkholderiales bacterium]